MFFMIKTHLDYIDQTNHNIINKLDKVAYENFGQMRDANKKEQNGVRKYIESISNNTGVNFFDLL